jgi:hypothetical protein
VSTHQATRHREEEEQIVNIYDPMDRIVYRHMDQERDPYAVPITSTRRISQLPSGYANGSPRTSLRRGRRIAPAA